jgi:ubiquinone/menaquinone biosynthesis C-methylase UbiE
MISTPDRWDLSCELQNLTRQDIWELRKGFFEHHWSEINGMKVLEVGSGPGHDSLSLARRGAAITAVDYSVNALTLAQKYYGEQGLSITTVCCDAMYLPYRPGSFDFVFNAGVLEHFDDDSLERVLHEMVRVVRRGGWVLAFCPNRYNVFYQYHLKHTRHRQYEYERAFGAERYSSKRSPYSSGFELLITGMAPQASSNRTSQPEAICLV